MSYDAVITLSHQCLLDLATQEGINASSRNEIYGCIFGRDSAITILKILKVFSKRTDPQLLEISRRSLLTLISLQGKEINIESGEEPGKYIHEFRKDNYHHLLNISKPWYIYDDGIFRNYESIDATPLMLIALHRYWQLTKDKEFLSLIMPSVEKALQWLLTYADKDNDFLVEYTVPSEKRSGGLAVHSWTDSHESLMQSDGKFPLYPIAAVEVQAYVWLALKIWADFYQEQPNDISSVLSERAKHMKEKFNETFIITDENSIFAAQALDGHKNKIATITANPLLCLWATYFSREIKECILDEKYIPEIVNRVFQKDMFDEEAGIRTMSTKSPTYIADHTSYHNGSFWPVLNGLIYEGLVNWNFEKHAGILKEASLKAIYHFQSPIELYMKDENGYMEYLAPNGQKGCRYQAWSAAAVLDMVTS